MPQRTDLVPRARISVQISHRLVHAVNAPERDLALRSRGPSTWKITNLDTNVSYTFTVAAARENVTFHADGSVTVELSGGIVGFNAPTDTPPGPFALTFSGRLVLNIAADRTGTIIKQAGTTTDLCAAVAP